MYVCIYIYIYMYVYIYIYIYRYIILVGKALLRTSVPPPLRGLRGHYASKCVPAGSGAAGGYRNRFRISSFTLSISHISYLLSALSNYVSNLIA